MGVFFTSGRHRAPVGRSLSCHYHGGGGGGGEEAAEAAARRVAERLCSRVHRPKDGATEGRRRILVKKTIVPSRKKITVTFKQLAISSEKELLRHLLYICEVSFVDGFYFPNIFKVKFECQIALLGLSRNAIRARKLVFPSIPSLDKLSHRVLLLCPLKRGGSDLSNSLSFSVTLSRRRHANHEDFFSFCAFPLGKQK